MENPYISPSFGFAKTRCVLRRLDPSRGSDHVKGHHRPHQNIISAMGWNLSCINLCYAKYAAFAVLVGTGTQARHSPALTSIPNQEVRAAKTHPERDW